MRLFILLVFVLFLSKAYAQPFEGYMEVARIAGTDTTHYKYYVREPNIRIEEISKKDHSLTGVLLMNLITKRVIAFSPQKKMWIDVPENPQLELKDNLSIEKTENIKVVAGVVCHLWLVKNKTEKTLIDYWVGTNSFDFFVPHLEILKRKEKLATYFLSIPNISGCLPLEAYQSTMNGSKYKLSQIVKTTKVEKKPIDVKMFTIPPGYRKFDMEISF